MARRTPRKLTQEGRLMVVAAAAALAFLALCLLVFSPSRFGFAG